MGKRSGQWTAKRKANTVMSDQWSGKAEADPSHRSPTTGDPSCVRAGRVGDDIRRGEAGREEAKVRARSKNQEAKSERRKARGEKQEAKSPPFARFAPFLRPFLRQGRQGKQDGAPANAVMSGR